MAFAIKKLSSPLLAGALALTGCASTGVPECNAIHEREKVSGQKAIAALDRCLEKRTTSVECKSAMDVVEEYTSLSTESTKCARENRLKGNLLHSQLQLNMVTSKLEELEKRNRSEQRAVRRRR